MLRSSPLAKTCLICCLGLRWSCHCFACAGPGDWSDDARLDGMELQYKNNECVGPVCWNKASNFLNFTGVNKIEGAWSPPTDDGQYTLRVQTHCKPAPGTPTRLDFETAHTPEISGYIDRSPPKLISLSSTSQSTTFRHVGLSSPARNRRVYRFAHHAPFSSRLHRV